MPRPITVLDCLLSLPTAPCGASPLRYLLPAVALQYYKPASWWVAFAAVDDVLSYCRLLDSRPCPAGWASIG